jgi:glutamate-1-semialdehyde 2,1-aminomutase
MEQLSPLGPVYQAGTLSGNPVAMAAGIATLQRLLADGGAAYRELDRLGGRLQAGLQAVLDDAATGGSVVRVGSILWLSLQPGPPPRRYERIDAEAAGRYARLHAALLDHGVYLAPSAYEVMFVSLAHDDAAIDATITAFGHAVSATRD